MNDKHCAGWDNRAIPADKAIIPPVRGIARRMRYLREEFSLPVLKKKEI